MSSPLVPQSASYAALDALGARRLTYGQMKTALEAAAPYIVAAELRRIIDLLSQHRFDPSISLEDVKAYVSNYLRNRADDLDSSAP